MKLITNIISKIHFLVLTVICFPILQSCAQPPETPITYAKRMVQNQQYLSAFEFLDSLDTENKDPDIFLLKQEIAVQYYIATVMHQMFAFENLKKNQDIKKMRKQQGSFMMKELPIHEIFDSLIQEYPKRYDLYNAASEFYYVVLKNYPEGWIMKENEIKKKIETYAPIAIKNKSASAKTYYLMAYLYSQKEEYNQALTYYAATLDKDPEFADAYYNLALTQMYRKEFLAALTAIRVAIDLYEDSVSIAQSSRLAGYICEELSDDSEAYKYFLNAWELDDDNIDNIHALTDISVRLQKIKSKEYSLKYIELAPNDAEVYGGLIEIYAQYGQINELVNIFESQMPKYAKNSKAMANLYYFTAGLINVVDKERTVKYLKEAKLQFKKFLPESNEIFIMIDDKLSELK